MLEKVAIELHGTTNVPVGEKTLSFKAPFKRISIHDAVKEKTGIDISKMEEEELLDVARKLHVHVDNTMGKGKLDR